MRSGPEPALSRPPSRRACSLGSCCSTIELRPQKTSRSLRHRLSTEHLRPLYLPSIRRSQVLLRYHQFVARGSSPIPRRRRRSNRPRADTGCRPNYTRRKPLAPLPECYSLAVVVHGLEMRRREFFTAILQQQTQTIPIVFVNVAIQSRGDLLRASRIRAATSLGSPIWNFPSRAGG
jgi:hypothetical protein